MRKIYRIIPDSLAPELFLHDGMAERFTGESVIHLSPEKPFEGHVAEAPDWRQFYRVGSHAFAVFEEAWKCEELYYNVTENNMELIAVETTQGYFEVLHPRQFLARSSEPFQFCDLTYVNSLFRIDGFPDVFCFEGMPNPDDEFKRIYERFGFKGLVFEEVWRGK